LDLVMQKLNVCIGERQQFMRVRNVWPMTIVGQTKSNRNYVMLVLTTIVLVT